MFSIQALAQLGVVERLFKQNVLQGANTRDGSVDQAGRKFTTRNLQNNLVQGQTLSLVNGDCPCKLKRELGSPGSAVGVEELAGRSEDGNDLALHTIGV